MEDVDQEEADTGADGRPMLGNDYDNDDNEDGDEGDDNDDAVDDSPTRQRPGNGLQCPIPRQANAPGGRASPPRDRVDNTTDERMRDVRTPEKLDTPPQPSPLTPGRPFMAKVRPDMVKAELYDIAPTIAAPHSTSINTITATPDMRWVFSGGGDGWIRKFNWVDTVNAKSMLTVAQRHPFVDSVTKAGVLMSYWENEEPSGMHTCTLERTRSADFQPQMSQTNPKARKRPFLSPQYTHWQSILRLSGCFPVPKLVQSIFNPSDTKRASGSQASSSIPPPSPSCPYFKTTKRCSLGAGTRMF